jgi:simple sugar transport system permease protein
LNNLLAKLRSLLVGLLAVLFCLALTAAILACLPSTGDEHFTFTQSLQIIAKTIWNRVILPRPPYATEGYRNWIQTLQSATPILLTGLAVAVAFRANVLNIGGQGQYVLGAAAAAAVGIYVRAPAPLLITLLLLAAVIAGALFAAIAAALERWRNVPVVLSTLLLNFVALEFLRYLLQGPMRATSESGAFLDPQSRQLPLAARLPEFFSRTPGQGLHLGFFIALAVAALLAFVLRRTTFGFRLQVVGQNPHAARFAGMNVPRLSFATLALSGALAGLAGGLQVAGVATYILFPDVGTDGLGFTGIAVALLGRLSPLGVILSAIFFGLLGTGFKALERSPLEIHSSTAQGVQGLLVIAVLISYSPTWIRLFRRRRRSSAGSTDSKVSATL